MPTETVRVARPIRPIPPGGCRSRFVARCCSCRRSRWQSSRSSIRSPDFNVQALLDASTWFAWFHVIQLVLTGLVALSVLLLAADYGRANAWTTRLGIGVFLVFFSAYDTLAGIGTGLAMHTARDLPAAQQEGVFAVVKDWPGVGPVFALSIVGTLGWVVAVGALALAARRLGASRPEWIALALAAVFLLGGHPFPQGTLAFGSLFVAVLFHEWRLR